VRGGVVGGGGGVGGWGGGGEVCACSGHVGMYLWGEGICDVLFGGGPWYGDHWYVCWFV
jgi:hypothetical protein